MKKLLLLMVVVGAGAFAYFNLVGGDPHEAVVASLCADELNADLRTHLKKQSGAMNNGNDLGGGVSALNMFDRVDASSLARHTSALARIGNDTVKTMRFAKAVGADAFARCPTVVSSAGRGEYLTATLVMIAVRPE